MNIKLQIAFDPASPGSLLATYRSLLGDVKPSRTNALLVVAERLVRDFMAVQRDLTVATMSEACGFRSWLARQRRIKALKRKALFFRERLISWVTSTLMFFRFKDITLGHKFGSSRSNSRVHRGNGHHQRAAGDRPRVQ